ncbi:Alpha-ketoglutarate-dependent taurine dioxygenase [Variovorax sp. PBS-H4]|uniref:TauD/TfdA dioxygenase family protein n=1 Tax=Variovorax sp. PBS-H4 TaxID=434008 RepID=UPI001317B3F4|nr:TauD/TfdA family dioxygenase [Variovorax sp. PBS-H4]VTU32544.1 Alpha-ketoglutarate-dependent taurine dioxygenase [Variovorax sp. PBS-H4]
MNSQQTPLEIRPCTPTIGAEVSGFDLDHVSDATAARLRDALVRHEVLFLRDQKLTPAQHVCLAEVFGQTLAAKSIVFPSPEGFPAIEVVEYGGGRVPQTDIWHTDIIWQQRPALGAVLCAEVLPETGGDTLWASMTAAYEALSPRMQAYLEGLTGVNTWEISSQKKDALAQRGYDGLLALMQKYPPVEHPIVRTHPVSGRKILYCTRSFTSEIKELPEDEGRAVLEFLFEHVKRPEFHVRFQWRAGSVAIWDNRSTQHYAVNDYMPNRRRMHRVAVAGDVPF